VARIKDPPNGPSAHSVIEAVGTQESMMQAIRSIRSIRLVGYVASRTTSNSRRGALLLRYPPARQSRNCPSLPPRTDQPHLAAPRRPRQGL
jgi:hypothetical protein